MLYIAYGSNLDKDVMRERCPNCKYLGRARLSNTTIEFRGEIDNMAYLTLKPSKNKKINVAVYEIDENDEKRLDVCEGYPELYYKKYITFEFRKRRVSGLVYIMNPKYSYHVPSNEYFDCILSGYETFGFDNTILYNALEYARNNKPKTLKR